MHMQSIAFVIPYFGKLPDYLPVWLTSCAQNPTVDFYLFTDDSRAFAHPKNVKIIPMTFNEAKARFQKQFDFEISLSYPYKLCDYRPIYGLAFSEWLAPYDFWGYCDLDVIWGNLRHFFTDSILSENDRVMWLGHCSIYRNTDKMNHAFRELDPKGCMNWRDVFTSEKLKAFDEYAEHNGGGISLIMERNGIRMYKKWIFADLCVGLDRFQCSYTENQFYTTEEDSRSCFFERTPEGIYLVYRKGGELRKKEVLYVHFQKRPVKVRCDFRYDGNDTYLLLPPGIVRAVSAPLSDAAAERQLRRNNSKNLWSGIFNGMTAVKLTKRALRKAKRMTSRG